MALYRCGGGGSPYTGKIIPTATTLAASTFATLLSYRFTDDYAEYEIRQNTGQGYEGFRILLGDNFEVGKNYALNVSRVRTQKANHSSSYPRGFYVGTARGFDQAVDVPDIVDDANVWRDYQIVWTAGAASQYVSFSNSDAGGQEYYTFRFSIYSFDEIKP